MYMATTFAVAAIALTLVGIGTAATYPVVLGLLGGRYKSMSGTAFGIAIAIALAGSTVFNMLVGSSLLGMLPVAMIVAVVVMITLFTIGNKLLNE